MLEVPDDKKSYLDRARGYLYSGKITIKPKPRVPLHQHDIEVPHGWKEQEDVVTHQVSRLPPPTSMTKKFFLFSVIFFSCALAFAGVTFLKGSNTFSNRNIDLVIVAKPFVDGGEELPVSIEITNRNPVALELADLVFVYTKSSSEDEEPVRIRQSLNTIPSGKTVIRDFPIQLYGEEGSERTIRAGLEYRVEGSNAIFEKEAEYLVVIRSTPITLTFTVPDATLPNQEVEVSADITLNAAQSLDGLMLKIVYPTGFDFKSATPEPSFANNLWLLPPLEPAGQTNITLKGIMQGPSGEERVFRAEVGSQSDTNEREIGVVYTAMFSPIEVRSSFISVNTSVNGNSTGPISAQSEVKQKVIIAYRNTLETNVRDIAIVAHIHGDILDKTTLLSSDGGFINSRDGTITWDKTSKSDLAMLSPGKEGQVSFSFVSQPIENLGFVKPEITISTDIRGIDIAAGDIVRSIINADEKVVRYNSNLALVQKTLFYSGPISNTGPVPPRVDQETSYTIVWVFTNTVNEIRDIEVRTALPAGVIWKGIISPQGENLIWNPETREILWKVDAVTSSNGSTSQSKEIAFQVSVNPSLAQKGRALDLTKQVSYFGIDTFSGAEFTGKKAPHTTKLVGDTSLVGAGGVVQ